MLESVRRADKAVNDETQTDVRSLLMILCLFPSLLLCVYTHENNPPYSVEPQFLLFVCILSFRK